MSYTRVIRDGIIRTICWNLLVPGDFVVLLPGENVPHFTSGQPIKFTTTITTDQLTIIPCDSIIMQVEEFPAGQVIQDQLNSPRRTRFIFSMLQEKFQKLLEIGLISISIAIFLIIYFKLNFNIQLPILMIVPLAILSSPILHLIWWLIGSCYLSLLLDQLIRSETPFSETSNTGDSRDIDEFDEDAPPPVMNIKIPFWKVASEVMKWIIGKSSKVILRNWDGDIIEALALTSVLCFVDREGPISNVNTLTNFLI